MDNTLRIAAVQFPMFGGRTNEEFLRDVERYIKEAKDGGAGLVVFPELITADLIRPNPNLPEDKQMKAVAQDITPGYLSWLLEKSVEYGIAIMGGSSPRLADGNVLNTAYLVFSSGEVFQQDKCFLTPDEKDWNFSCGQDIEVFETPIGKVSIMICFDCEMPALSASLSREKPEIILIPSWTASRHGFNRVSWSARARAIEHYAYVVKTGTVAAEGSSEEHHGQASIMTPQDSGFPLETADGSYDTAGIVFADLNLKLLRSRRTETGYYPDKEQDMKNN